VRIRQVKPAFWTDDRIASLPAPVRLFYIGLWMVADDAGWFRWNGPQLGAELYSFEGRAKRERNVEQWGELLEGQGRIRRYPCGHSVIPTMTDHQRMSAATKRVKTYEREHEKCVAADARGNLRQSADARPVGNVSPTGTEPDGRSVSDLVAGAREPKGRAPADSAFRRLVDRDVALGVKSA
jgi:hypothetical protein